jgi:hypothetical protein
MVIFVRYPLSDRRFKEIRNETESRKLALLAEHHESPAHFITPNHKA